MTNWNLFHSERPLILFDKPPKFDNNYYVGNNIMKATQSENELKVEDFIEECRKRGLSVTPQRVAVYKSLAETETHPTAEEIYGHIRKALPTVSLATVYKTLDTFESFGFVSKTRATGEQARFDANRELHHHLICKECGRIEDYYDESLSRLSLAEKIRSGFKVEDYRIDFRGFCKMCRPHRQKRILSKTTTQSKGGKNANG